MARRIKIEIDDLVDDWRTKTNTLSNYFGDLDELATDADSDLVEAINEINLNSKDSAEINRMIDSNLDSFYGLYFPVDSINLGDLAVDSNAIQARSVGTLKLQLDAVTGIIIATDAIDSTHVGSLSLTTAMVQDLAITNGKIADNTIQSSKFDSTVTLTITDSAGTIVKTLRSPGS